MAGLIVGVYRPSLDAPFVFDDQISIVENESIRDLGAALAKPSHPDHPFTSRPIAQLSFALDHAFHGMDPSWFRTVNVAIHLSNVVSLALVMIETLRTSGLRGFRSRLPGHQRHEVPGFLPLVVAGLWGLHPQATEAVIYLTQRTELLMSTFVLLTLYCSFRGWRVDREGTGDRASMYAWYLAAGSANLLAVLCKEVAVATPLLVLLIDRALVSGGTHRALSRHRALYVLLVPALVCLAAMMAVRPESEVVGFSHGMSSIHYLKLQAKVLVHYLGNFLWPARLTISYHWTTEGIDYAVPGILTLAALSATALGLIRNHPAGLLGAWIFLLLAPTSSFLPLATEVAADRRMYLPQAALVIGMILPASLWLRRRERLLQMTCGALLLGAAAGTMQRCSTWTSAESIWRDAVAKNPSNPEARNNLAQVYMTQRSWALAMEQLETTITRWPDYDFARYNWGVCLLETGHDEEALEVLREVVPRVSSREVRPRIALARAWYRCGYREHAVEQLTDAVRDHPHSSEGRQALSRLIAAAGDAVSTDSVSRSPTEFRH